jgi:hypothetical protein
VDEIRELKLIRYWGRKPPSMVVRYIEEFSNEGEIVLDPFGGSGSIVKTALALKRRAIYVDLNPFAKLIAEVSILGCPCVEFKRILDKIINDKKLRVKTRRRRYREISREKLFSIKCPCGKSIEISSINFTRFYIYKQELNDLTELQRKVLDVIKRHKYISHGRLVKQLNNLPSNSITKAVKKLIELGAIIEEHKPLRISYVKTCDCGRTELSDISYIPWVINEPVYPAYWYPKCKLEYSNGISFSKKRDVERIYEFFDDKTLTFLSYMWHKIKNLKTLPSVKRCFYLLFMVTLTRSSKMARKSGGTWPINSYWIPRNYVVKNPFYIFLKAAKKFIRELSKDDHKPIVGDLSTVIQKHADVAFILGDAKELPIPNESIDYIITDPPHTDEAQFFELSYFYTSWTKDKLDFKNELIVNLRQGKDIERYFQMYSKFVQEARRVLKPGKYFTVILHDEDNKILKRYREVTEDAGLTFYKSEKLEDFYFFTFSR